MRRRQASTCSDDEGSLPVFVSPSELTYYADDISSHKQVLTIYNPYGHSLKYKVLCTAPRKYQVIESEGFIKSHCCIDVVVRHKGPLVSNDVMVSDKFQIQLYEQGASNVKGHKLIIAQVLQNKPKIHNTRSHQALQQAAAELPLQALPNTGTAATSAEQRGGGAEARNRNVDPLVVVMALVCGVALLLPTWEVDKSTLPPYLHLTIHQKLVVAYFLGLVTMAILHL